MTLSICMSSYSRSFSNLSVTDGSRYRRDVVDGVGCVSLCIIAGIRTALVAPEPALENKLIMTEKSVAAAVSNSGRSNSEALIRENEQLTLRLRQQQQTIDDLMRDQSQTTQQQHQQETMRDDTTTDVGATTVLSTSPACLTRPQSSNPRSTTRPPRPKSSSPERPRTQQQQYSSSAVGINAVYSPALQQQLDSFAVLSRNYMSTAPSLADPVNKVVIPTREAATLAPARRATSIIIPSVLKTAAPEAGSPSSSPSRASSAQQRPKSVSLIPL